MLLQFLLSPFLYESFLPLKLLEHVFSQRLGQLLIIFALTHSSCFCFVFLVFNRSEYEHSDVQGTGQEALINTSDDLQGTVSRWYQLNQATYLRHFLFDITMLIIQFQKGKGYDAFL